MAPTASAEVVSPPAPLPAHETKIVLRQFRKEDLDQVIQLFKDGMLTYPKNQQDPHLHEYIDNSLKTDLSDIKGTYITPGGNFWIATPRNEPSLVVGMVGLEAKPNAEGELRRMSVKSTHRRYGIGRLLISTLEKWAVEHQFRKVWLTTGGVMNKARAFYTSTGYTETEVIIVREDPPFEVIKIEKMLTPASYA
ncbi:N-acetyltransferase-like protein [Phytophthora cinnamomi]|uniref:N-acetyltransferase-like protein n=1 Tax=Phytophthora cinnamomi TaxID=4785 RepID=UPI003559A3EA|nr:N-acetyltransferase-like protein [Phytophthora cinnamomi]